MKLGAAIFKSCSLQVGSGPCDKKTSDDRYVVTKSSSDFRTGHINGLLCIACNVVAAELKCPLWRKVEMSEGSPHGTPVSPDLIGRPQLQDQIGAGGTHPFVFSFETIQPIIHSAACCRKNAFSRRAITAGSFMTSFCRPGPRARLT